MSMKWKILKVALLVIVGVAGLGWVVMTLWNWLVPGLVDGVHQIDYLHAMGLLVLSRILFGGMRGRGGWHGHHHRHRWEQMSEEERAKFKDGMRGMGGLRGRWGRGGEHE